MRVEKRLLYQNKVLQICCEGHWLAKFDTRKALYWKDPCYMLIEALRNKLI